MSAKHAMSLRDATREAKRLGFHVSAQDGEVVFRRPGQPTIRVNGRRHAASRALTLALRRAEEEQAAASTLMPRVSLNQAAEPILVWLREHPGRYARADLPAAARVPDELWLDAIRMLESRRDVIRTGEKKGTRDEARRTT
jgi:hypothetical protein